MVLYHNTGVLAGDVLWEMINAVKYDWSAATSDMGRNLSSHESTAALYEPTMWCKQQQAYQYLYQTMERLHA